MESPPRSVLGVIAGNGVYPSTMINAARKHVPGIKIVVAAFVGETRPEVEELADAIAWFRVGQIKKPLDFIHGHGATEAVMVGQIAPDNLFTLRPDFHALLLLGSLKQRNAESIFTKIAEYAQEKRGVTILPATTYMDDYLPPNGHICGPKLKKRQLSDAEYGLEIAKEISRLDIGQTVLVRHGTVLAVEGFEGTNACIKRGGELGKRKDVILVKVSKPKQDIRFDVPCVGPFTIETCLEAGVKTIIIDAKKTILLEPILVAQLCDKHGVTLHAMQTDL